MSRDQNYMDNVSSFLDHAKTGFCLLDGNGIILEANQSVLEKTGSTLEELRGKSIDTVLTIEIFRDGVRALPFHVDCPLKNRGTRFENNTYRITLFPATSDIQNTSRIFALFVDITEYARLEDTLWRALEEVHESRLIQSRFLANVNHELRTPLNSILGMSHLLLDSDFPPEQTTRLNKIKMAALHLLQIIDDIIGFKDFEHNVAGMDKPEDFLVEGLLAEVLPLPISDIRTDKVSFILKVNPSISERMEGHPLYIGRIIQSLVGNAIKYTSEGFIKVDVDLKEDVSRGGELLSVRVEDTGQGIQAEYIPNLFTPFSQEDASSTRKYGGLGMGLAVAQKFARRSGGDISVSSTYGKGSTFTMEIPIRKVSEPEQEVLGFLKEKKPLIFGVVNDPDQGKIISEYCRFAGGDGIIRQYGEDASQVIGELKPDAVLLLMEPSRKPEPGLIHRLIETAGKKKIPVILWAIDKHDPLPYEEPHGQIVRISGPFLPRLFYQKLYQMYVKGPEAVGKLPYFNNTRILIVEDNPVNQEVVGGILEKRGIRPYYASNGESALTLLEENNRPYDLILMDIQMPGMNGIETCRRIRKSDGSFYDVPIVALTANTDSVDRDECIQAGMQGYLVKPVDPPVLFKCIAEIIPERVVEAPDASSKKIGGEKREESDQGDVVDKTRVDLNQGLARTFDDRNLFNRVLEQFSTGYSDFENRLREYLQSEDREGAVRLAHSLKGVAANLGLLEIHDRAKDLEMALRDESNTNFDSLISATNPALDYAFQQIHGWTHPEKVEEANGESPVVEFLDQFYKIESAVQVNDVSAAVVFRSIQNRSVPENIRNLWEKLGDSLKVYDYEKARSITGEISARL